MHAALRIAVSRAACHETYINISVIRCGSCSAHAAVSRASRRSAHAAVSRRPVRCTRFAMHAALRITVRHAACHQTHHAVHAFRDLTVNTSGAAFRAAL